MHITIDNLEDLKRFADLLSEELKRCLEGRGVILGLCSGLGGGKTTLTRFLCQSLGSKDHISSPTFALCQEYRAKMFSIEHWDLYRLSSTPEELFDPPSVGTLRIIEWVDRCPDLIDDLRVSILDYTDNPEGRSLELSGSLLNSLNLLPRKS